MNLECTSICSVQGAAYLYLRRKPFRDDQVHGLGSRAEALGAKVPET